MFFGYISGSTQEAEELQRTQLMQCGVKPEAMYGRHGADGVALQAVLRQLREGDALFMESANCLESLNEFQLLAAAALEHKVSILLIQEDLEINSSSAALLEKVFRGIRAIADKQRQRPYSRKPTGRPKTDNTKLSLALKLYEAGDVTATSICSQLGISRSVLYRAIGERRDAAVSQVM